MANLESQSFKQPESQTSILTPEESAQIWCALTSLTVYADRKNSDQVGQPLSDFHKSMLSQKCGEIDFGKWVTEDETNKDANYKAFEALKKRQVNPQDSK